ncbi:unnamed protein product [Knipowitschia caucasica]|uniref:Uncharacterized protein n=1 Tax=Knipowitschia caucasica TaxID=637954 RepID=A0AAV2MQ39_KNICA
MKLTYCMPFALLTLAHAGLLLKRDSCQRQCNLSQCPSAPQACYYGRAKDSCGCCVVCGASEGEKCGGAGGAVCGDGMRCERRGVEEKARFVCVCQSNGVVCGSDGRTYPSVCRLRAENARAKTENAAPVTVLQRGECHASGEGKT